jgi:hypothetical protein
MAPDRPRPQRSTATTAEQVGRIVGEPRVTARALHGGEWNYVIRPALGESRLHTLFIDSRLAG